MNKIIAVFLSFLLLGGVVQARQELVLDETCVVNILNRTVQVKSDGTFFLTNVPSFMGRVRARATCVRDGVSVSGSTDFFQVLNNQKVDVPPFYIPDPEDNDLNAPVSVTIVNGSRFVYTTTPDGFMSLVSTEQKIPLTADDRTFQLQVVATYADGTSRDVTASGSGINYTPSNPAIFSVSPDGLITALQTGRALLTVRLDGAVAVVEVEATLTGDVDGDGLPDDYENANGLDPADPVDAQEDIDGDGLSALEEYNLGTNIRQADTDGDGLNDREETIAGEDGQITDPLDSDSDDDGLNDNVEFLIGSDPNDAASGAIADALDSLSIRPATLTLTFNSVDTEVSDRITVIGHLIDGSEIDLTSRALGTNYISSDLSIASFGGVDGEIFGGAP